VSVLTQGVGREPERGAQEIDRALAAENLAERLAITDAHRRRVPHRRGDKLGTAKFEKSAMADVMARAPIEHLDRILVADQLAQGFPRLVPIDQEHERSADRLQEGIALVKVRRLVSARDEIERLALGQTFSLPRLQALPAHGKLVELVHEELGARFVHVGVRDRDDKLLDADQQHMGVRGADVILNDEMRARAHGDGIEPRMIEFEVARPLETFHESLDRALVFRVQAVGVRAGNHLLGALRGETVERLVQIHDQAVKTVALATLDRGHLRDCGWSDAVLAETEPGPHRGETRVCRFAGICLAGSHRLDHRRDVGEQCFAKLGDPRRLDRPREGDMRPRYERSRRQGVDAGAATLRRKVGNRSARAPRVLRGGLKRAQAHLGRSLARNPSATSPGSRISACPNCSTIRDFMAYARFGRTRNYHRNVTPNLRQISHGYVTNPRVRRRSARAVSWSGLLRCAAARLRPANSHPTAQAAAARR